MNTVDETQLDEEVVDAEIVEEGVPDEYAMVPVLPNTGEAVVLRDMEDRQLAVLLDEVRQWERADLRDFKRQVQEEVLARMDRNAEWTLHVEDYDLRGDSPNQIDYDVDELRKVLANLQAEGLITKEAAEAAIRVKIEYEPAKSGLNKLLKLGGRVEEAVKACQRPSLKARSVSITRKTSGGAA